MLTHLFNSAISEASFKEVLRGLDLQLDNLEHLDPVRGIALASSLGDLPRGWVKLGILCLLERHGHGSMLDRDGRDVSLQSVLSDYLDLRHVPEGHAMALSALRLKGTYRFRVLEALLALPTSGGDYVRNEQQLLAAAASRKIRSDGQFGSRKVGEMVRFSGELHAIVDGSRHQFHMHPVLRGFLLKHSELLLGRARLLQAHRWAVEWIEFLHSGEPKPTHELIYAPLLVRQLLNVGK